MTDKSPTSTTFIFVDRRKSGRGKSLPNRQKLLKRIKDSIRNAKPADIDADGVRGAGAQSAKQTNPIKVARDALAEPNFMYDYGTGDRTVVLPGNDRWLKGDEFPVSGEGEDEVGRDGEAGQGEDGEDDFIINISRSEFFDVYFADCELPNLQDTHEKDLPEAVLKPAGFQKDGNPGQLSVIRSFKNSIGRRKALTFESRSELEELQTRLNVLMADEERDAANNEEWCQEVATITSRIAELKDKIGSVPFFEKVDHRYRKTERVLVKSADAVLMMLMDISGSMDEDRKRAARKFFSLQYAFIQRAYPQTDLVFIYHTDTAEEVSEEEFFTSRKNGGTTISPAFQLAHQIVKTRYDASLTNIYLSYAGDGDNWGDDNKLIITELEDKGLLAKIRHAVYIQVGNEPSWPGSGVSRTWNVMESISKSNKKLNVIKLPDDSTVFSAFKKIYGKKGK